MSNKAVQLCFITDLLQNKDLTLGLRSWGLFLAACKLQSMVC